MFKAIIHEGIEVIEGLVVGSFGVHEWDCKSYSINRKSKKEAMNDTKTDCTWL
jgi:hypothetical protein